jgi:hypothetical protein
LVDTVERSSALGSPAYVRCPNILLKPTAKPGERVRFGLEPGHLHLFDAETERALAVV